MPNLISKEETRSKFYLRLLVLDKPGVLEKIGSVFGQCNISILKFLQQEIVDNVAEVIIMTHSVKESDLKNALEKLKSLKEVQDINSTLRFLNA